MNIFILLLLMLPPIALAQPRPTATVDIYGTNTLSSEALSQEYKHEINDIAEAMLHGGKKFDAINKVAESIKAKRKFAYVHLSPIIYTNDPVLHITVDIVEEKDKHRLAYFEPIPQTTTPNAATHLIKNWQAYEKAAYDVIFKKHEIPTYKNCPAHHCLFGFDHPALRQYHLLFNSAEKYKTNLVKIARLDKNENNRAAAIFILAHINDYNELVRLVMPSIWDSSSGVRNNALRVIGFVATQHPNINVPIEKIVTALDFPDTTDRNKALFVINALVSNPRNALYVKQHAGKFLINTLKLQQPNNHDISYQILKKISGKNYGERDYNAWEKWLG